MNCSTCGGSASFDPDNGYAHVNPANHSVSFTPPTEVRESPFAGEIPLETLGGLAFIQRLGQQRHGDNFTLDHSPLTEAQGVHLMELDTEISNALVRYRTDPTILGGVTYA